MVERAPKPGGGVPVRRAKRRSLTVSTPRAHAAGALAGAAARTFVACVTVGTRMGARRPRGEHDVGRIERLGALRAAVDDGNERDDGVPGLVAREGDRHVVEAGGAGEREAERRPRAVGHGVAHLGDGDVELGRPGEADPVGLGGRGDQERQDEHGKQNPAHAIGIPPQIDW